MLHEAGRAQQALDCAGLGDAGDLLSGPGLAYLIRHIGSAGRCLLAAAASTLEDPVNRAMAMKQDRPGWVVSERAEISNHVTNETWVVRPISELPRGRHLVIISSSSPGRGPGTDAVIRCRT